MVTISQCRGRKDLRLFERVPELLHREDPYFVPPFPGSVVKLFDPKAPFHRHGKMIPFIAWENGKPVGRVAAIVNGAHNAYYGDKVGFFGFLDSVDRPEVVTALLDEVERRLRAEGLETVRGPYNPTVNDECGVLVEGFDAAPMVMMPYNPPYYPELYERAGLERARDLYAFYISAETQAPERIRKIVERVKKRTGIEVRNLNLKRLEDEIPVLVELYNQTLDRNWGFVPITHEDMAHAAGDLKAIVDPEMIMIAEKDGVPVGFSMTLPNINEFLWKTKGSRGILRVLRFLWLLKTSHPREARLAVLGVRPEYRNKGVAPLFYFETLARGKREYVGGELSWVEETNEEMARAIELMGGSRYKTYRIYEKPLRRGEA